MASFLKGGSAIHRGPDLGQAPSGAPKPPTIRNSSILPPPPHSLPVGAAAHKMMSPLLRLAGVACKIAPVTTYRLKEWYAQATPDSVEYRGPHTTRQMKAECRAVDLIVPRPFDSNDHKVAAQRRSTADTYIVRLIGALGYTPYAHSGSAKDVKRGISISRPMYDCKDEVAYTAPFCDEMPSMVAHKLTDMDYYLPAHKLAALLSTRAPLMLYTFALTSPAGTSDEMKVRFNSAEHLWEFRTGRGSYNNICWNWTGEAVTLERVEWDSPTMTSKVLAVTAAAVWAASYRWALLPLGRALKYPLAFAASNGMTPQNFWWGARCVWRLAAGKASLLRAMLPALGHQTQAAPHVYTLVGSPSEAMALGSLKEPLAAAVGAVRNYVCPPKKGVFSIMADGSWNVLLKVFGPLVRPICRVARTGALATASFMWAWSVPLVGLTVAGTLLYVVSHTHLRTYTAGLHRVDLGEQRAVVVLIPERRAGTLASVLNHSRYLACALRPLEPHVQVVGGQELHSFEYLPPGDEAAQVVVAVAGTFHSTAVDTDVVAGMICQNAMSKGGITQAGAQIIAKQANGDATLSVGDASLVIMAVTGGKNLPTVTSLPFVPDPVTAYVINPQTPEETELPARTQAWANCPISQVYGPAPAPANDTAAVFGRVNNPRTAAKMPTERLLKEMGEFVSLLFSKTGVKPHSLNTATLDEVLVHAKSDSVGDTMVKLSSMGLQGLNLADASLFVKSMIKNETYVDPKWPRLITIFEDAKLANASVSYPVAYLLKMCDWYAFGRSPADFSERVAYICARAVSHVLETDFSNYDGTVGAPLRVFEKLFCLRAFNPQCHDQVIAALDASYNNSVKCSLSKILYEQFFARGSGDHNTANFNSLDASLIQYVALRRSRRILEAAPVAPGAKEPAYSQHRYESRVRSPAEAWADMGIIGGDDGVIADITPAEYEAVCAEVGTTCKVKVAMRDVGKPTMLARCFGPAVWNGDTNSCCDIRRALGNYGKTTTSFTPETVWEVALCKAMSILATDAETPYIGEWAWKTATDILATTTQEQVGNAKSGVGALLARLQRAEATGEAVDTTPTIGACPPDLMTYNYAWAALTGKSYPNASAPWMSEYAIEQLGISNGAWEEWLDTGDYQNPPTIQPHKDPELKAITSIGGILMPVADLAAELDTMVHHMPDAVQGYKSHAITDPYDHPMPLGKEPQESGVTAADIAANPAAAAVRDVVAKARMVVEPAEEMCDPPGQSSKAATSGKQEEAAFDAPLDTSVPGYGKRAGRKDRRRRAAGKAADPLAQSSAKQETAPRPAISRPKDAKPAATDGTGAKAKRTPEEQKAWLEANYTPEERAAWKAAQPKTEAKPKMSAEEFQKYKDARYSKEEQAAYKAARSRK